MSITITTWNVNSLKVRQPQVLDFLKETENSILCLQELKMQEADSTLAPSKKSDTRWRHSARKPTTA